MTTEKKRTAILLNMAEAAQRYANQMDLAARLNFTACYMAACRAGLSVDEINGAIKQGAGPSDLG